MSVHGANAEVEPISDERVGEPYRHEPQHFNLTLRPAIQICGGSRTASSVEGAF